MAKTPAKTTRQTHTARNGDKLEMDVREDGCVNLYTAFIQYGKETPQNDASGTFWLSREGAEQHHEQQRAAMPFEANVKRTVRVSKGGLPARYLG